MRLYPLLSALPPDPVEQGWARVISREPRTVGEVLRSASDAMDAEDEAERLAADPIAYARAHRPRHNLLTRLLYGKAR